MQEDSKERTKIQESTKGAKWHGNEEQMNISIYHMLQSCGVQDGILPKDRGKNVTYLPGLKRAILTLKSWFPFS